MLEVAMRRALYRLGRWLCRRYAPTPAGLRWDDVHAYTAVDQYIQSFDYVAGDSGWLLNADSDLTVIDSTASGEFTYGDR